jgi:hypothetical protein
LAIEKGQQEAFAQESAGKEDGGSMIFSQASNSIEKKL